MTEFLNNIRKTIGVPPTRLVDEGERITPPCPSNPRLLLHPNIPKPLHGVNPRSIKGRTWWTNTRREVYKKAGYCCEACGHNAPYDHERKRFFSRDDNLHAHEIYKIDYVGCIVELERIVALCPQCHSGIHSGRLNALFDKGEIDIQGVWEIYTHCDRVLQDTSHRLKAPDERDYSDEWNEWYLLFEGVQHFSKFDNYEEWNQYYNGEE